MDSELIETRIADALMEADTWVGLSGRHEDPDVRERWARIVFEHDDLKAALRYLAAPKKSTCAITVQAFFRECGVHHYITDTPYLPKRDGRAIIEIEVLARAFGAWVTKPSEMAAFPEPGDVMCVDIGNPHVLIVTGSSNDGNSYVCSIDGGQSDGDADGDGVKSEFGAYVQRRMRRLDAPPTGPELVDVDDGESLAIGKRRKLYVAPQKVLCC